MTLQQLKYIIALDDHRHFARAANECMVTQPGLTIQLKNLEDEVGIKIFDRSKVPLKPTVAGEEIINKARKVLREADAIRDFVISRKNDLEGTVKLGVISTLSPYLMPLFIKAMGTIAPKMHFIIKELNTGQLMHGVEAGIIDIALMATPTGNTNLREYPVFYEPFVAYLYPGHLMANEAFYEMKLNDRQELLLLESEYCYNAQLLDICSIKEHAQVWDQFSYDISSIETLKNLVKAGLGFAIVPQLAVLNEQDTKLFKPFAAPAPAREISLVVSDTFSRKLLLEKISECIYGCLPETIKQNTTYKKIRWNDSPYFINAVSGTKG